MILADLGADVIKIETPGIGDDTRSWGPPFINGESAYFLCINRNKKSLTLDLKRDYGKKILYELVEKSDVFLENFRPGVTEELGVDYGTICKINPRIIYCSITGFGQNGPYRNWPAYDIIIQGMGGLMSITGELNRPPVRIGVAVTDIGAGMYAAIAILSALIARNKIGKGQFIDVSLFDSTISWLTYMAANYFATGEVPKRIGSGHPNIVPYQCFKTRDKKYLTVAVGNDRLWRSFCKAIGMENLINNPMFATNSKRVENRKKLISELEKVFLSKTRDEWIKILLKEGVPCGPVYTISEIFNDSQVLFREMLIEMEHAKAGRIKQIGNPMKFSRTPGKISRPPPLLGEHTEEILKNLLGYSYGEIRKLKREGII